MRVNGTNLTMVRGDSETVVVFFENTTVNTGDKLYLTVRKTPTAPIALQKIVGVNEDGHTGITFTINHNDTASLDMADYVYDIQLTRANGTVTTLVPCSVFTLAPEVTY